MAYADRATTTPSLSRQRVATIAGVAAVHLVVGYVFVTGMAVDFARDVTRTLTTTNIPLPPAPPPPEPTPQPRVENTAPTPSQPTAITFVAPLVPSPAADHPVAVDVVPPPPLLLPTIPQPAASASPPVSKASGAVVRGRADWITTADYPASALRAGDQGRVGVAVAIGANGRVSACEVTEPSGSSTLDAATCRLYAQRARFTPARDDAGRAVASRYTDRVRWQLPRN